MGWERQSETARLPELGNRKRDVNGKANLLDFNIVSLKLTHRLMAIVLGPSTGQNTSMVSLVSCSKLF